MAECVSCKTETQLYDQGVPVCSKCSEALETKRKPPQNTAQIRTVLVSRIVEATARVSAANQKFSEVMGQYPSGLPHPQGVQRIESASKELTIARKEMMTAHKMLNEFIEHGIVPEDLKKSSLA